jgi:hypothetical protein
MWPPKICLKAHQFLKWKPDILPETKIILGLIILINMIQNPKFKTVSHQLYFMILTIPEASTCPMVHLMQLWARSVSITNPNTGAEFVAIFLAHLHLCN